MANAYNYSNTAVQTTLGGNISNSATSFTVGATTGFPSSTPYVLALDYGAASEELVVVTGVAGTTLTVTRGFSGTSAQSHSIGAVVRHVYNAQDATDFRTHEAATSDVHGVTGALVGATQAQTLTNKTLTSPTINGAALSGTFSGTPAFSGATTFSGGATFTTAAPVLSTATSGTTALRAMATGDTNDRFQLKGSGQMEWGPGTAARDSIIFRDGSGQLGTTDTMWRVYRNSAGSAAYSALLTTDTNARFYVQADGQMFWGPGNATQDVNLYRGAANQLKTDDDLVVGGSLTVSGVNQTLRARKTADTNVTSNTTPTDDPHLVIALAANTVYEIQGLLLPSSTSTTGDFKLAINGPAGCAGYWTTSAPGTTATGDPDNARFIATQITGGTRSYGIAVSGTFGLQVSGMVETTTAGSLTVQWAQATSDATALILRQYSWIRLTKVA